ncbi:hypothetical protein QN277_007085 [Acacia crassicarpa]|uniref:Uncharacterized protein n=1 Tax=Acacia crassicarpa TaxID=499986 RepID=A0AAE1IV69_9FABA|nr:hypothetical protein QN277_007082 [Acacia crassicarpa]KAK4257507.1 hypothetical protein QN277_007085 [Acacia crassicarpa]
MADEDLSRQEGAKTYYANDEEDEGMGSVSCGCFVGSKGYMFLGDNNSKRQHVTAKLSKLKNFLRYKLVKFRINKKTTKSQFHYDPKSYALNFDDGSSRTNPVASFH